MSLRQILEETGRFDVTVTEEPAKTLADAEQLATYRAFVLDYNGPRWGEPAESNFLAAVRGGTGVVVVHAADNAFPGWKDYEELVGLLWRDGTGHGRFHPFDVTIDDADHPITRGMRPLVQHPDELYHRLVNVRGVENRVLGSAFSDPGTGGSGEREPMIIVRSYGRGRVFHTPLGHVWRGVPETRVSQLDPQFRRLIARGTEWAATGAVTLDPVPPNLVSPEERSAGFVSIFDGRTLEGWTANAAEDGWDVDHASLHCKGGDHASALMTVADHGDCELRFEWAVRDGGEAAVLPRVEPNVVDGVTALARLIVPGDATGEAAVFRRGRIIVRHGKVECWIDHRQVAAADAAAPLTATGRIALRCVKGDAFFRSLRIRPWKDDADTGDGTNKK